MSRLATIASAVAVAVGAAVLGAGPAYAAPPIYDIVVPVPMSNLVAAGYTCSAGRCTKPGSVTWTCQSTLRCYPLRTS